MHLAADSLDLASFDRAQTRAASGNVWQEIVNLVGLGAKNQDCDCRKPGSLRAMPSRFETSCAI